MTECEACELDIGPSDVPYDFVEQWLTTIEEPPPGMSFNFDQFCNLYTDGTIEGDASMFALYVALGRPDFETLMREYSTMRDVWKSDVGHKIISAYSGISEEEATSLVWPKRIFSDDSYDVLVENITAERFVSVARAYFETKKLCWEVIVEDIKNDLLDD